MAEPPLAGGAANAHPCVMPAYAPADEVFVAGRGAELRTDTGSVYLDFLSGIGVSALGHGHPALTEALVDQAAALLHVSNLYRHPHTEQVAERLVRMTGLAAVLFANSGAEANEAALKIARKHQRDAGRPGRTGIVALEGGFHGRTMGALSVTAREGYRAPYEPLVPGVSFVPAGDLPALERAVLRTAPAAVVLEPIQGEAGIVELDDAYLRAVRELCTRTGTVLVHDEVQSGCGRTGAFLAAERAGVLPDLVTLGKPLAAGLPVGAVVASRRLAGVLRPGDHGSTFAGGPLVLRAALVFLNALEEGLMDHVARVGARLRSGLERIVATSPLAREVRGRGLMLGVRLRGPDTARTLQATLHRDRKLLANAAGDGVLRLLPPYVLTEGQVDDGLRRIGSALAAPERVPVPGGRVPERAP